MSSLSSLLSPLSSMHWELKQDKVADGETRHLEIISCKSLQGDTSGKFVKINYNYCQLYTPAVSRGKSFSLDMWHFAFSLKKNDGKWREIESSKWWREEGGGGSVVIKLNLVTARAGQSTVDNEKYGENSYLATLPLEACTCIILRLVPAFFIKTLPDIRIHREAHFIADNTDGGREGCVESRLVN